MRTVAAILPIERWPASLVTTAVDAETGAFRTFDADSGVSLVAAVAASCAIPGVFPPVTVGGRRYIDGGVRSGTCADLAAGHDLVVVVALTQPGGPWSARQAAEVAGLRAGGSRVVEILPGPEPLTPGEGGQLEPSRLPGLIDAGIAADANSSGFTSPPMTAPDRIAIGDLPAPNHRLTTSAPNTASTASSMSSDESTVES